LYGPAPTPIGAGPITTSWFSITASNELSNPYGSVLPKNYFEAVTTRQGKRNTPNLNPAIRGGGLMDNFVLRERGASEIFDGIDQRWKYR
jgi:hypothetical protein